MEGNIHTVWVCFVRVATRDGIRVQSFVSGTVHLSFDLMTNRRPGCLNCLCNFCPRFKGQTLFQNMSLPTGAKVYIRGMEDSMCRIVWVAKQMTSSVAVRKAGGQAGGQVVRVAVDSRR